VTGAEKYDVMGFEFDKEVGFRVVVKIVIGSLGIFYNNENSDRE